MNNPVSLIDPDGMEPTGAYGGSLATASYEYFGYGDGDHQNSDNQQGPGKAIKKDPPKDSNTNNNREIEVDKDRTMRVGPQRLDKRYNIPVDDDNSKNDEKKDYNYELPETDKSGRIADENPYFKNGIGDGTLKGGKFGEKGKSAAEDISSIIESVLFGKKYDERKNNEIQAKQLDTIKGVRIYKDPDTGKSHFMDLVKDSTKQSSYRVIYPSRPWP